MLRYLKSSRSHRLALDCHNRCMLKFKTKKKVRATVLWFTIMVNGSSKKSVYSTVIVTIATECLKEVVKQ